MGQCNTSSSSIYRVLKLKSCASADSNKTTTLFRSELSTAGRTGCLGEVLSDQWVGWVLHRPVELAGISGM